MIESSGLKREARMIGSRRTPSPRRDHHRLGTPAWDLAHDSFAEQRETWSPRTLTDRHNLELRRLAEQHAEDQGRLRAELDESREAMLALEAEHAQALREQAERHDHAQGRLQAELALEFRSLVDAERAESRVQLAAEAQRRQAAEEQLQDAMASLSSAEAKMQRQTTKLVAQLRAEIRGLETQIAALMKLLEFERSGAGRVSPRRDHHFLGSPAWDKTQHGHALRQQAERSPRLQPSHRGLAATEAEEGEPPA